jgi:hypothetical protein
VLLYNYKTKKSLKDQLSKFIYLHFQLHSHYIKVYIYFVIKFHTFGFILKNMSLSPLTCIWVPNMWSQRHVWLSPDRHLVSRNETRSLSLTDKTTTSLNTHSHFDYCDISISPTTTLTASLIRDVSYCHVSWICISFASSRLLWMNELCNKSYFCFQTSTAKVLSCTDYKIITRMIITLETMLQLQWHILWRSSYLWCHFQYQPIAHFLATKILHSDTS